MPNWTFNTIRVSGNKEHIAKMMNDAIKNENGEMTLRSWFPIPETFLKYDTTNHPNGERLVVGEEYWDGLGHRGIMTAELLDEYKQATKEQRETYGVVGWYDYNCKYFGCKWSDCDVKIADEMDGKIVLSTDTPWTSPDMWLIRLSERYPDLLFENHAEFEDGFWQDTSFSKGFYSNEGEGGD